MEIKVYAVLKDYYTSGFHVKEGVTNLTELKAELTRLNPAASTLINLSRFAVNDTFVNNDYRFNGNEFISIIPGG